MIDLRPDHLEIVRDLLRRHVPGCEVRAFGSRFKWTAKQASDLDLAVVDTKRLPAKKIMSLKEAFEESILPMRVDVLDWHTITSEFQRVIEEGFEVIQGGEVSPLAPASSPSAAGSSATPLSGDNPRNAPNVHIERDNWAEVELQELANEITVGFVGSMASEYVDDGIPFLRSQNIDPLCVNLNDLKYISQAFHEKIKKSKLTPGDVVIVRTGKPGACAVIPEWLNEANCSDIVIVRCGPRINNHYLAYYVNTAASHHVSSHIVGAVQQHFNVGAARTLKVKLPPLSIQNSIVKILGTLDDRIELCRLTNEALEAMAQALFKDWFIDFGPVRAKLEGRDPYLSADVWSLFPDRLIDSDLGEIPESWRISRLDEVSVVIMGLSPSGDSYNAAGVGLPLINGPVEFGEYFPTKTKWTEAATRFAETGDLIFCVRGSTTGRRVISDGKYGIGRGVCAIRSKTNQNSFIYQLVNLNIDRLLEKTTGSVFPSLNGPDIKGFQFVRPSDILLESFQERVKPILEKMNESHRMIVLLSNLRDSLLPKLLSGEINPAGIYVDSLKIY
jgi:type I restriction enzyme, S subunit